MTSRLTRIVGACGLIPACIGVAHAQTASPQPQAEDAPIAEIVVTAQKRSESLQKTPLSISAVTGAKLADQGVISINQLNAMVPNVQINTANGVAAHHHPRHRYRVYPARR